MSLEIYSKEYPANFPPKKRRMDRYFYAFISIVGIATIIFAAYPFFVWQVKTVPKLASSVKDYPVPPDQVLSVKTNFTENIQVVRDPDGFSYFVPTDLENTHSKSSGRARPEKFSISIPKLKIEDAITRTDNLDFKKNLSHFPGTALPGELGNSFITGHSVLPQFSDPKNYNAIFTKLSDLEIGDKINIEVEGQKYQYIVQYSKVVDPHDLSVLNPISENGKNLTLMTCVPPGTNIKRLVVITSLI